MSISDYDDGYRAGVAATEDKYADQDDRYDDGYDDGYEVGYESCLTNGDMCNDCEDVAPRLCGNCMFLHPERHSCYWYPSCDIHDTCKHWEAFELRVGTVPYNQNYWPVFS